MDQLKGIEALGVVYTRVSDGYEVIKCILDFYKEMADVERTYALKISKLCQSTNYTFHSNILAQWLGGEPFEEIGTLKHCWQNLGNELLKLASIHNEKSESFYEEVREPLLGIQPELLEDRNRLRQKKNELENELKNVNKRFQKIHGSYFRQGDILNRMKTQAASGKKSMLPERKISDVEREFKETETQYLEAYRELVDTHRSLNESINSLLVEINDKELKRVEKVAKSLQEFARTLSNTAPAYLEGMKRIVMSVDEINGQDDIRSFVQSHSSLQTKPDPPSLEYHHLSLQASANNEPGEPDEEPSIVTSTSKLQARTGSTNPTMTASKPVTLPKPKNKEPLISSYPSLEQTTPIHAPTETTTRPSRSTTGSSITVPKKRSVTEPPDPGVKPSTPSKKTPVAKIVETPQSKPTLAANKQLKKDAIHSGGPTMVKPTLKPKPESIATPPATATGDGEKDEILDQLQTMAQKNNYYSLLGVASDASREELARARREVTAKLHPDHFIGDPEQQAKASDKLIIINQAFHDVLNKEESKKMYDQLCRFREKYHLIEKQEKRGLESAKVRLSALHSNMKKARCPLPLLKELQLALQLIDLLLLAV